jgi:phosphatidylserine decarboxylase
MLEVVCWDQDRFRKEYLGEMGVSITELFSEGALSLDDPINQVSTSHFFDLIGQPRWVALSSSRKKAKITGDMQVKAGLIDPSNPNCTKEELQAAWDKFVGAVEKEPVAELQAMMDYPATESVGFGMIRANTEDSDVCEPSGDELDDELTSSEPEEVAEKKGKRPKMREIRRKMKRSFKFVQSDNDVVGVVFMEVQAARDLPPERNGDFRLNLRLTCSYAYWL